MRARRTPHHHPPRPADIRGPEDALAVVHAALGEEGGIVVVLLDRTRGDGTLVVIDGAADADLEKLLGLLLDTATTTPFTEVVLATSRPGAFADASLDDVYRWFALEARAADAGVVVLDWFILADGLARSMAETSFSADRW